jgi:fumarylacetoacetate (FAA) hydrolase
MKLASLPSSDPSNRNGELIVVSSDNTRAIRVEPKISLIAALENWNAWEPKLRALSEGLNNKTAKADFQLDLKQCISPLPHCHGFYDGSAFLSHVVRARRARGDQMPESAKVTPLMYQGVSDFMLPWSSPIDLMDVGFGGDFEAEFGVILRDVPKGTPADQMAPYFALFCLFNDITYREIVKQEIETKFGFLQSKPNSSFAPIVVTPDELGSAWDGKRILLNVEVKLNNKVFGHPNGREMHFSFGELVAHANRTRPLSAGTIVGTGTVSNESKESGFACLTEKRFQEIIENGKPSTPWLQPGDHLEIDCLLNGVSLFGAIDQVAKIGT